MKYKKSIIILIMAISVLLSIAGVCACDADEQALAIGDMGQIDLSQNNDNVTDDYLALGDGNSQNDVLAGSQDTLNPKYANEWGSGKSIEINDSNYNEYFSESGTILENANISDNDTIILGKINDKFFDIDRPLTITSNGTVLNNIEITLNKGSDNSIIENLTIMNEGDLTVIFVSEAENVTIISNKISVNSVGNDNDVCAVFANLANNLKIMDNIFKYVGRDNDVHYNSNIVLDIIESDDVLIEKNDILFDVESNATASNKVIRASQSDDLVISHNTIAATIPSRSIDWYTGTVYSEGICLEECNNVELVRNNIIVASSGYLGEYDTVYGVHNTGDNASVCGNVIGVVGAPYGYGLVMSGEGFEVLANVILAGTNITEMWDNVNLTFFTEYDLYSYYNAYECLEDMVYMDNVTDIKTLINHVSSYALTPYAAAVEIEGYSTGTVKFNFIGANAVSSYGIYTANWAGDVQIEAAVNFILQYGDTVFGISLSGSEASVEYTRIADFGNYTTGIASVANKITISNVSIDSLGSNEGTPLGYDMMGIETTGVHIVSGYATIEDNRINTTGKYAVDFKGEGSVTGNDLTAELLTGDFAVDYIQGSSVLVDANMPSMELDYILTNDTFCVYFDEEGKIREQINADNLTFMGPFSNLVDYIIIDRPIALISDDARFTDMGIEISSDNVSVDGFEFHSDNLSEVICVWDSDNVSIFNCSFNVEGVADEDNFVIYLYSSDNVSIDGNGIDFTAATNGTYHNNAIHAYESYDLTISNNAINPYLPARPIDWNSGEVYSVAVSLDGCDDAVLEANDIFVTSGNSISDYDIVYAVHVLGNNARILGNEITVNGAPYGYGIAISGANFTISENNQICVESDCYSCCIEVDGFSDGVISHNSIDAKGDSAYGIYTANWAGDVKVKIASNVISAEGITSFGMSLSASEALVEQNQVIADGNFTTGIASAVDSIIIKNNTVDAKGSDVGTPAGHDTMGIETVGVHIVRGYATITDNNISNSGEYAIDIDGESLVDGNYLVAYYYLGDLSVSDAQGMSTVKNNRPSMKNINISADDIELLFGEECIVSVNVTDEGGNSLSGVPLQLRVGNESYNSITDRKGSAVFDLGKLNVGRHNSILSTMPNLNHYLAIKKVKVVVKKVASKITAKSKTFKTTTKTKKYTITLKDSKGNPIKKAKVYLKVKGKTYTAKTNSKGKATFKITKLSKSGKYKAVVTFKGNDYYKKSTKKVKIVVKSVWKTVSRGNKDKNTVKKIQQALKDNGYYLSYKGHYLMVDGKFASCTERSLKEFQKDHGLKVTGKVDEKTAEKLKLI